MKQIHGIALFLSIMVCTASLGSARAADTADQTASPADTGAIAEIVVTAQRREERLQDVPITVNVVTSEQASAFGVSGTQSLSAAVPSLIIDRAANNAAPYIRGIGASVSDPNSESSVAIYLDGVYLPTAFGNFFEFNNIDQVEVLKGPQGTLFGRNATGGVIQVTTRDPEQKFTGDFSTAYESFNRVIETGYLSGGLTDTLSANVALLWDRQYSGWGHDFTTDTSTFKNHDLGVRSKILFKPDDETSIRLAADYGDVYNGGLTAQNVPGSVAPIVGTTYPGRYNTYSNDPDASGYTGGGLALTVDHNFGDFRLNSVSAYRNVNGFWRFDNDASAVPLVEADSQMHSRMVSEEVHLLSRADAKLQWLAGLYYFNYKAGFDPIAVTGIALDPDFTNPNAGVDTTANTLTKSGAAFAQATYPVLEATNLTLGVRETHDKVDYTGDILLHGTDIVLEPQGRDSTGETRPTWRISLDHKFTEDILGYVSYNRGFKGGNFSVSDGPVGIQPYQPEKLDAYETGLKTEFLEHRLQVNSAIYYYDFNNVQLQRFVGGNAIIFNGPKASIYGGEIEILARPTNQLTLNMNFGALHSAFGNFPDAPSTIRLPNGITIDNPEPFNADGDSLPDAPKFTGNVGAEYRIPSSVGTFSLASNVYYNDGRYPEVDNRLEGNAYTLVNASVGWKASSGMYDLKVYGKNLANAYYYSQMIGQADVGDLGAPAGPPRTFGIQAGVHF
jgi:iron complex outermembrane receptor protein